MDAKDIMKAILAKGSITITESDLKASQNKEMGMIEQWDKSGNKEWIVYIHEKREH